MKLSANFVRSLVVITSCSFGVAAYGQTKKRSKKKAAPAAETAAPEEAAASATSEETPLSAKTHRAPYGMAGCGLGSLVIKNNNGKGAQIGAGILNATGVQTFGISTGTSNCRMTKADLAQAEQEVFLNVNLASLAKDAAQGRGEHLSAFAEILGCGAGEDLDVFSSVSRDHYEQIFQGQDSKVVLSNYKTVIKSNETLAKSCVRA